jgi:hypothetical protein
MDYTTEPIGDKPGVRRPEKGRIVSGKGGKMYSEDGGDILLRNVGCNSTNYTASYPRR